uniref:Translocon-associated protein subunit gamma n=1 Tax=Hemiselmis tepida TaxID=464990 RepID=A0A7S0YZF1_9CRYP
MAPKTSKKEDWETLNTDADARLPAAHSIAFLVNSVLLAGAPAYLFATIFDLSPEDNMPVYGGAGAVTVIVVFMALQSRAKGIRTKLLRSRGVELESTSALKLKDAGDERVKAKLKEADKQRSNINAEALSLSMAHTNALFLFVAVLFSFWIMRASSAPVNLFASSVAASVAAFLIG